MSPINNAFLLSNGKYARHGRPKPVRCECIATAPPTSGLSYISNSSSHDTEAPCVPRGIAIGIAPSEIDRELLPAAFGFSEEMHLFSIGVFDELELDPVQLWEPCSFDVLLGKIDDARRSFGSEVIDDDAFNDLPHHRIGK